jgi:hypothetical protein
MGDAGKPGNALFFPCVLCGSMAFSGMNAVGNAIEQLAVLSITPYPSLFRNAL